ncbi:MAG: efflux RND transporter periplasmic adaptor subunit [Burkholderiales bacterium]
MPKLPQLLVLASLAALLAGCSKSETTPEPVRAIKVITVGLGDYQSGREYAGEVRARVESRLGFRVAGKLLKRQAELGQHVKAGQVLAQLDAKDYQLAADAAKAQVAAAATNRDLAAADFKRFKELREQNFISGAELERRETTLKAAQASLEQAQAQLASQGNQTGYANLVADVAGVVTAIEAEPGQVLAAGAPVLRLAQDGVRDVVFAVPEDQVTTIAVGTRMGVRLWAGNTSVSGVVREVAASADPVTRTYGVKLALELAPGGTNTDVNANALTQLAALGSTVFVSLDAPGGGPVAAAAAQAAKAQVIKLPTSALLRAGDSTSVWVLDASSMTVKQQPVVVAGADGNEVVIASGLQPGMQVAVAGVHVLAQGQKVSLYQPKNAPNPAPVQAGKAGIAIPSIAASVAANATALAK